MAPSFSARDVRGRSCRTGEMSQANGFLQRLPLTHHLVVDGIPRWTSRNPRIRGIRYADTRHPLSLLLAIVLGQILLEGLHRRGRAGMPPEPAHGIPAHEERREQRHPDILRPHLMLRLIERDEGQIQIVRIHRRNLRRFLTRRELRLMGRRRARGNRFKPVHLDLAAAGRWRNPARVIRHDHRAVCVNPTIIVIGRHRRRRTQGAD
jgi:hypothetical protein